MTDGLGVLVVGAGLMGSQIGCEYALGGHSVTFLIRDPEGSRARVSAGFAVGVEAGTASEEDAVGAASRVAFVETLDAVDPATSLVVESIPEDLAVKRTVLRAVAARLPDAVIASNTSSIPLTELGAAIGAAERTLGTHYWNPPLLMPLVEVVAGEQTRQGAIRWVCELLHALGKEPVLVERDVPGFIWNRLQAAVLRESLWLVEQGVASPATVDRIVRSGLARRYRYIGPFETVSLGGLDAWTRVAGNLFPQLSNAARAEDLGRWLTLDDGELDAVRARRDNGLVDELGRERAGRRPEGR
jgi:3-hydroxybutyryl-CoA dehydrogenase